MTIRLLVTYICGALEGPREIFSALSRRPSIELTAVCPSRMAVDPVYDASGFASLDREQQQEGYRLVPVPLKDPLAYWRGYQNVPLARVIDQVRPDVIHVFDEPLSGSLFQCVWLGSSGGRRARVLHYGFENLPLRIRGRNEQRWQMTWQRMAGGVAANQEALDQLRRAGFPSQRPLQRVFWGTPSRLFRPLECSALRDRFGGAMLLGFVGRFVPQKGLHVILQALQQLPQDVHCVLIGCGPMRDELQSRARQPGLSGRVHLVDPVKAQQLAELINCMDLLLLPSLSTPEWKEQYGRVIGEAMACGVPVIGSDSGAIPEVIGDAGLVVPEGDAAAMAATIQSLISDPQRLAGLSERGLARVDQELGTEAMARKLKDFYRLVLGNSDLYDLG